MGKEPFYIKLGDWSLEAHVNDDGLELRMVDHSKSPRLTHYMRLSIDDGQKFKHWLKTTMPLSVREMMEADD